MVSKTLGYFLSGVALLGLIISFEPIGSALGIKLPITSEILTIASVALLVIGLILIAKGSKKQKESEVPIYHGKNVVGYRRIKQ